MNVGVLRAGDTVGNRPQPYILVGAADVSTDRLQRCCKCHMEGARSLIMEDLSPPAREVREGLRDSDVWEHRGRRGTETAAGTLAEEAACAKAQG